MVLTTNWNWNFILMNSEKDHIGCIFLVTDSFSRVEIWYLWRFWELHMWRLSWSGGTFGNRCTDLCWLGGWLCEIRWLLFRSCRHGYRSANLQHCYVHFLPLKLYRFLRFRNLIAPIFVKVWIFIARSYISFSGGYIFQNSTTCQKFRFQKGMCHKKPFVVRVAVDMMCSEMSKFM